MWDLVTCANGEPNVILIAFKDVTEDRKLSVEDVFLKTTIINNRAYILSIFLAIILKLFCNVIYLLFFTYFYNCKSQDHKALRRIGNIADRIKKREVKRAKYIIVIQLVVCYNFNVVDSNKSTFGR